MILNYEKELINPDTKDKIILVEGMALKFNMGNTPDVSGVVTKIYRDKSNNVAFDIALAYIGSSDKSGCTVGGTLCDFNKDITKLQVITTGASRWIYRIAKTPQFLEEVNEESVKCQ